MSTRKKSDSTDDGLTVKIRGGKLVISIGVTCLARAFEQTDYACPFDERRNYFRQRLTVTDVPVFAREVAEALQNEEENGDTPVTKLLDRACVDAVKAGALGVYES